MDNRRITKILKAVEAGTITVNTAMEKLKNLPYEDVGVAMIDHHRELRHGIPEVIFAEGKDPKDVEVIAEAMLKKSGKFLITKATKSIYKDISAVCGRHRKKARFYDRSGMIAVGEAKMKKGMIAVFCAGTSDLSVAEEAVVTASFLGSRTGLVSDVGVAGLHRLADAKEIISKSNVMIVAAGMEGALPSVIGGMTDKPIIAVPTSVGYGTSFGGITALSAMLNSCVPGIAVMNIDNGFGAAVLAHKINISTKK